MPMLLERRDPCTDSRLVRPRMKESGREDSVTALACRDGQTELSMKDTGKTIVLMARVSSPISMEMSTKATGSMIRLMELESTLM